MLLFHIILIVCKDDINKVLKKLTDIRENSNNIKTPDTLKVQFTGQDEESDLSINDLTIPEIKLGEPSSFKSSKSSFRNVKQFKFVFFFQFNF